MHAFPRPLARSPLMVRCLGLSIMAFVAGSVAPARADDDAERQQLANISYELQRLRQMVGDAQRNAASDARVKFQYSWLSKDLELVQRGVDEHLDAPRQPRVVQPLRGDYRQ